MYAKLLVLKVKRLDCRLPVDGELTLWKEIVEEEQQNKLKSLVIIPDLILKNEVHGMR